MKKNIFKMKEYLKYIILGVSSVNKGFKKKYIILSLIIGGKLKLIPGC